MVKLDRNNDQLLKIFDFFGELPVKFRFENFITSKVASLNFRGSLWGLFYAIMFISGVIGKIEPIVTRLTRKSATVKGHAM